MSDGALIERQACPGCGGLEHRTRYAIPYADPRVVAHLDRFYGGRADQSVLEGVDYELRACRRCSLLFQAWAPDEQLLAAIYDEWIDPEYERMVKAVREGREERDSGVADTYPRLVQRLIEAIERPAEEATFLDVGMGWGELARTARDAGFHVVGVELSEERRAAAEADGIEVVTPDELRAGPYDGTVDVAVALQTFEHLVDPARAARTMARMLRPGGIIHLEVPSGVARRMVPLLRRADWEAPKNSRWSLNPVEPLEHLNCFGHGALRAVLIQADLRPLPRRAQRPLSPRWTPRTTLLGTGAIAATARRAT